MRATVRASQPSPEPTRPAAPPVDLVAYNAVLRASPGPLDLRIPPEAMRGRLPEALRGGTYYLNGPGLLELGGKLMHPFDGHGYVRRFHFTADGGLELRARFVETECYLVERAAGRIRYRGLSAPSGRSWLENLRMPAEKNVANTCVVPWAGRLVCGYEGAAPHALDPVTLETRGLETFGGALPRRGAFLAHTRIDARRRRLVGLAHTPGPRTALRFCELDEAGQLVAERRATLSGFALIHDFLITPRWYVLVESRLEIALGAFARARLGLGSLLAAVRLGTEPARLHLVPREGGEVVSIDLGERLYLFHYGSAHEEGEGARVVLEACLFDGFDFGRELGYQGPDRPYDPGPRELAWTQRLERITVDVTARRALRTTLGPWVMDFPRVHPERDGEPCRYLYAATASPAGACFPADTVARVDLADGSTALWQPGQGAYVGEPMPAPRPGATAEDDGWVVVLSYDGRAAETALHVLDARHVDAGPVATVPLGMLLPYGFHGWWQGPSA